MTLAEYFTTMVAHDITRTRRDDADGYRQRRLARRRRTGQRGGDQAGCG